MVGRREGGPGWSQERAGRPEERPGQPVEGLGWGEVPICEITFRMVVIKFVRWRSPDDNVCLDQALDVWSVVFYEKHPSPALFVHPCLELT